LLARGGGAMKLAFVTTWDPHSPQIWAGTGFHIARALQSQGCTLDYLGPLRERNAWYFKALQMTYRKLWHAELQRDREPVILDGYSHQIAKKLAASDAQIVFSVGAVAVAHLQTSLPIVFWADATYASMVDSYRWNLPASKRSRILGAKMEAEGLRRAALAIYSSEWAARSAIDVCRADPAKVRVVPFGANVQSQRNREEIQRLIESRPADRCRLLFIGVGWERKGGDIAIEVARRMNAAGIVTELSILGSTPPQSVPDFVKPIGFLDKNTEASRKKFDELFGTSHFLILPARAEAFGVVLCEAGSYGVPALATRVGGIPTIVRDGINGLLFDPEDPESIADAAGKLFSDRQRYQALALSSFNEYDARLNWHVAGKTVTDMLRGLIQRET
jgi:glycosyltransferase involved in cell wall biosynthesis